MTLKWIGLTVLAVLIGWGMARLFPPKPKFVLILQAGKETHEGLARALHFLLYAEELKKGGYDVVLIFDGAGTEWAEAMRDPQNKLHDRYQKLVQMGAVEEICDFCSGAFKVKDGIKAMGTANLVAEFEGHPSLKRWVDKGYQVIIL